MSKRMVPLTLVLAWFTCAPLWAAPQDGSELELPLQQAIEMALENNLDIVVARVNTQAQGENVFGARGAFKPLLTADFNNLDSRTPANNQLIGAPTLARTTSAYNFAWQQQFSLGLNYSLSFRNQRGSTNSAFSSFNPLYDTSVSAQITQPLLRNLHLNASQQQVVVAQNGERVARFQFEQQVMDTVRDVHNAYWDLVGSLRALEVAQRSLELAQELVENNRIQVEVGTMAPIDVLEAEAEVASREEALLLAQEAIERTGDTLNRLINDPESEHFWDTKIRPLDEPAVTTVAIDLEASVRTALQRRPELGQSRTDLDTRNYNVRYTRNQVRPSIDLVGSLLFSGLGGNRIERGGFAGEIIDEIPGGYTDALDQLVGGKFRDWTLGVSVSYPVGHSTEVAAHAQAQVQVRGQRAAIRSQELIIVQEVRDTARQVETNRKRIDVTRVARELAVRRLEAEQRKFDLGMSTSFLVVQAQRDLVQAAVNELVATIDFTKALVAFERARGTLLDRDNITVR
jgi:outer membrane protein TolC